MDWTEIKILINDIIKITDLNQIRWTPTDTEGEFSVVLGMGIICIDRAYEPSDDDYNYYFTVKNNNEESIFQWFTDSNNRTDQDILKKLYDSAENSSLQRDVTFDSIKNAIKNIKEMPF